MQLIDTVADPRVAEARLALDRHVGEAILCRDREDWRGGDLALTRAYAALAHIDALLAPPLLPLRGGA